MDLPVFSLVSHSSLLTAKSVDLLVAHDGFLRNKNRTYFSYSGYFDSRGATETSWSIVLPQYIDTTRW